MQPTEREPRFGVCPECGADTSREDGEFKCKNCGHVEKIGV